MKSFWTGFEKQARWVPRIPKPGKIKPATGKPPANQGNVLNYAEMNKPKAAPAANTLDYSKMKGPEKLPNWQKRRELQRRETAAKAKNVYVDTPPRGVVR